MNQDEWWRTLRCAGDEHDKAAVETLMLRYRPIAPKPVTAGQSCAGENSLYGTMTKRTKRKYVRVSKNNKSTTGRSRKGRSNASDDHENYQDAPRDIVTLQLLPEKINESPPLGSSNLDLTVDTIIGEKTSESATWIKLSEVGDRADPAAEISRFGTEVVTWVTVESVTVADGGDDYSHAVGRTDVEIMSTLDKDTCPGFISDGSNRVVWVNDAYRRMVAGGEGDGRPPETVVWLVTDETASFSDYARFTCRVRLHYTWQEVKYTKTVPCDAWKMDFGGFAWRLDTRAALTLWL